MQSLVVFAALLSVACAGLLSAPLVPKVQVGPTQVNVVRQPITVQQPELHYRNVPVPVRAVAYAAPAPVVSTYAAAPLVASTYAAAPVLASTYAAAPVYGHGLSTVQVA